MYSCFFNRNYRCCLNQFCKTETLFLSYVYFHENLKQLLILPICFCNTQLEKLRYLYFFIFANCSDLQHWKAQTKDCHIRWIILYFGYLVARDRSQFRLQTQGNQSLGCSVCFSFHHLWHNHIHLFYFSFQLMFLQ